ncbi:MAG: hypothetical protein F6K31_13140 [Symploca sp. SIO2G7]|nr:hypothetical protein [Symploca sp. SIO2G7]
MNFEEAFGVGDAAVFAKTGKHLTDVEKTILEGAWQGLSYEKIAEAAGYSVNYVQRDVGYKLWKFLAEALEEEVSKTNFRAALERHSYRQVPSELEYPDGQVPLDSLFYLQRPSKESLCYETILKPGSLLRIKAPKLMGKTSLMMRILAQAPQPDYRTVYLDLGSVELKILTNLDKFLRWLCFRVGKQLKLANQLNDYWNTEILSVNDNCTAYFEEYLLPEINCPLVLGLDKVDRIFPYSEVAEDFFGMLRSWHENGKIYDTWKQLRLVVAHSTEVYIPLDINQSPFNVGVPVELPEFNQQQVQELARLHGLDWQEAQVGNLMTMVGGHPYLIRLALYHIAAQEVTLEQLLQTAPTEAGIYSSHLLRHLGNIQAIPTLVEGLKRVVTSSEPTELDSMQTYKLHSLGLVQRQDNYVIPRCNLYREYFSRVL